MIEKRFKKWSHPKFDKKNLTRWNWMCQHHQNLKLGKNVDIGAFTYINAKYGVTMHDNVQIGSHCSIYTMSTIDNKKDRLFLKKTAASAHILSSCPVSLLEKMRLSEHSALLIKISLIIVSPMVFR